jgi:phosphoglycerate dehydrogenase-like enzyme
MHNIYVTEPEVINSQIIHKFLPEEWKIVEGTPEFTGDDANTCDTLLIRSATTVTSSIKGTFPQLKQIIRVGVGVDNIDMDFCNSEGIAVFNAPGANADAVSDYVVCMMLQALRKTFLLTQRDITDWNRFKFTGRSMAGRSIGIVGFGNIGKQVFHKLQSFNCKAFFAYDPFIKKEDMPVGVTCADSIEEVLRNSDIVTLHVPLLPTTKYLINKNNLRLMPREAILINTSRGGIVNEADVVSYGQHHDLVYIADTVEGEPHVSGDMLHAKDVIVTPHITSLTKESDDNTIAVALDNFLKGKPMNKPTVTIT